MLSQAGKAVMIKSVIQSLPTYVMSCLKLPSIGGLGFPSLEAFKQAVFAKCGWRLLTQPQSRFGHDLEGSVLSFLDAVLGSRPSATWRSILGARNLLEQARLAGDIAVMVGSLSGVRIRVHDQNQKSTSYQ
ncbi:UNVERIFIED_CONTAM: hypothetical protein Slati_4341600 [Sesamum latifolium]|uniref:Uncharacterized protein n=1 Tax=Sesamum latifolium TaxID=2727402 RepID=A0AAW2SNP9_9LAMI